MDYSYYTTGQQQQFQYGLGGQHLQPTVYQPDTQMAGSDTDIFRGLNNVGGDYDAYTQFSSPSFAASAQQAGDYPRRKESLQQSPRQPLQPPKSLSPDSNHDEHIVSHLRRDSSLRRARGLSGQRTSGVETMDIAAAQDLGTSGSEEKELLSASAQDRRKASNRAAQRAFRERKEKHVKELEAKLASLADTSTSLQSDNERLKRELATLSTQNEILRATQTTPRSSASSHQHFFAPAPDEFHAPSTRSPATGVGSLTPTEFVVRTGGPATLPLRFNAYPNKRGRMLLAGAAWDLIVRDPRVSEGRINLEEVCRRLKGKAMCDGQGPAFRQDELMQVLDECTLASDDLL